MAKRTICDAPGCDKPPRRNYAKYCSTHESRMATHGSFDLPPKADKLGSLIIGRRYGRLIGLRESDPVIGKTKKHRRFWFKCDCGTEKIINPYNVRTGVIVSCGCKLRESAAQSGRKSATHGESKTNEYRVYRAMLNRCYNPKVDRYPNYGGRGIFVCERWRGEGGYQNYVDDMGRKPSPRHSIDRIDIDGPYSPENCKWATREEQANNKQNSSFVEFRGKRQTLAQWEAETGIRALNIHNRIKAGWSTERALTMPTNKTTHRQSLETGCARSKSSEYGIWRCMIRRCHNPEDKAYPSYGGRGIEVCESWRHSFDKFYQDVGPRPFGLSLDRIDNDKGYSQENCRWADRVTQNNNKRRPTRKIKKSVV